MNPATEQANDTELTGERRLGHRIHAFSNLVQSHYYGRSEQPLGIALSEWRVLRSAILNPQTSQAEVAAGEGINVMNVSRAVASLKRKNLLDVESDPEDRRRTMLSPTELGRELGRDMAEREALMYIHIFSVLSPAEKVMLDDLLTRVNHHVQHDELPPVPLASRDWRSVLDAEGSD